MSLDVLCLRPEADFLRAGSTAPTSLSVRYLAPDDAQVAALMKEARALVIPAVGPKLAPSLFEGTSVKLVQVTGAGVDRLDEAALRRACIPVCNVPGGSNSAVAEYAVTCASMLLRRLAWADHEIAAGHYEAFRKRMLADNLGGLEGALVGIVGIGVIGIAVARAFHAAGCRIAYFDPAPREPHTLATLDAEAMTLEDLLRNADVVTLHVPLLESTRGLIGSRELALMKRDAVFVNAARGGIVDERALAARLESGELAGAAVDVYTMEPPTADNPLLQLNADARRRLILTPHIAGVTRQSAAYLFREAWKNVERMLKGDAPLNRVY